MSVAGEGEELRPAGGAMSLNSATVLATLSGARVNGSTWSPDGRRLAFVSYQVIR